MKKLIFSALVAGSMVAVAETAAPAKDAAATKAVMSAPRRSPMTEEQKAQMRARFEQSLAKRKAEMEARMLPIVKKYVPEEEKAKALIAELQEAMRSGGRRAMMRGPRPGAAKPAAEAK